MKQSTTVERSSEREITVTRRFNGPAHAVFAAWTTPALMQRWWMPKSCGASFVSCEMDVRTGGSYRLVFSHPAFEQPMAFFGRYLEVLPGERLVWTNDEDANENVTTVTFDEQGGTTLVVMRDRFATPEATEEAIASGSTTGFSESFDQLDEVLSGEPQREAV